VLSPIVRYLPALALLGCADYQFTELTRTDVFQQNTSRVVDLLVVIDNSGSMVQEQDNMARNFEVLIDTFADAEVSWRVAVTTTDTDPETAPRGLLLGGDDEVVLDGPNGEIDRLEYDRSWEFTRGTSLMLDPEWTTFTSNDNRDNWCAATTEFATGALGTPGERNPSCDGSEVDDPVPEADDGPRSPRSGDLVVSELMPESSGLDSRCEWFELTSTTDDTLDLAEVVLTDLGRNSFTFAEGTEVGPYGVLVVGRATDDNCDTPVDVAVGEAFVLNDDVRWVEADTPDVAELFAENVAAGYGGTGIEMGLEGARLVFTEPYSTADNAGFLRDEANLSLLFVSDEDDQSPWPVDDYLRFFAGLKGDEAFRDHGLVNLSAVVGKDVPPREDLPACESDNGIAWYGRRYLEAANQTDGLVESICEEDFAPIIERLGLTLSGLEADFELSELPNLSTLVLTLYEDDREDSKIRELERDVDYTYVSEGNLIHFGEGQVPPAGYYVVAKYRVLPTGSATEGER